MFENYIGITTEKRTYELSVSDTEKITVLKADTCLNTSKVRGDVSFTDYDENIIEIKGKRIYPKAIGKTYVTAEWEGYSVVFLVNVTE